MSWLLENADKVQTLLAIVGGVVLVPGVKPLIAWLVDDWQSDLKRKFDAWESADARNRQDLWIGEFYGLFAVSSTW